MFHYSNAITDTKGNALIGYYVRLVTADAEEDSVALYSDEAATPIESVSGIENAAEVNSDGNAQFYVADGEYHIDVYATDATTFVKRFENIPMTKVGMLQAATRAAVALMSTDFPVALYEPGYEGFFFFRADDLSSQVSADPEQITYIAPSSDDTGASGAWVRSGSGPGTAIEDHETVRITGCHVAYTGTGLTLTMSAGTYKIDGIQYSAAEQEITLEDADPTDNRIDVLYLDTEGVLSVLTGTPATTPSQPQTDPTTQLYLTFVSVPALATDLSGIDQEQIYDEATEWTITTSGTTWATASTNNPNTGTKCVEATSLSAGAYVNFATTPFDAFAGDGLLVFYVRSKATWNRNRFLRVQFHQGSTAVGNPINLRDGVYAFDSSNTSSYQMIIFPKSVFGIPAGTNVSALRFTAGGSGGSAIGFYLDSVTLQTNNDTIGNSPDDFITQADADARYLKLTGGTVTGDINVPDEAYGVGWNGSTEVPTKNAVYDAVSSISGGGLGALLQANNLSDVANASTSRTNLGLGSIATQAASNVTITGGSVTGITDLAVADGGTGASSASAARTNLSAAGTSQTGEQIIGFIASPSNKSYTIGLDMKHGGTITETTTQSASGTCTATWKINSTALGGTANSVSSSKTTQSHASNNTFAAGDNIVLTVSANSSCADMAFSLKYTRTLS